VEHSAELAAEGRLVGLQAGHGGGEVGRLQVVGQEPGRLGGGVPTAAPHQEERDHAACKEDDSHQREERHRPAAGAAGSGGRREPGWQRRSAGVGTGRHRAGTGPGGGTDGGRCRPAGGDAPAGARAVPGRPVPCLPVPARRRVRGRRAVRRRRRVAGGRVPVPLAGDAGPRPVRGAEQAAVTGWRARRLRNLDRRRLRPPDRAGTGDGHRAVRGADHRGASLARVPATRRAVGTRRVRVAVFRVTGRVELGHVVALLSSGHRRPRVRCGKVPGHRRERTPYDPVTPVRTAPRARGATPTGGRTVVRPGGRGHRNRRGGRPYGS
jgi:hypothetical protein